MSAYPSSLVPDDNAILRSDSGAAVRPARPPVWQTVPHHSAVVRNSGGGSTDCISEPATGSKGEEWTFGRVNSSEAEDGKRGNIFACYVVCML